MKEGTIKFAENKGIFVIKMEGDVRLTLALSFDAFIDDMLNAKDFNSVIFDLSKAEAIDSTTLGLMAKISLKSHPLTNEYPLVITNSKTITRVLVSMGFADIFRLVKQADFDARDFSELREKDGSEQAIRETVLDAHKTLMAMNDANANTFRELLHSLDHS